jgi:hypothetical protein
MRIIWHTRRASPNSNELFLYTEKNKMESQLSTIEKESEHCTLHTKVQTQLEKKTPLPHTHKNKREAPSLHDTPLHFSLVAWKFYS